VNDVTKRGRTIFWGVGLALISTIGALCAIKTLDYDPDAIKAELEARIEELNKIPAEEAIRKERFAAELLENELYKKYAKALWLKVERAHRALHAAAQLERAAQKEIPPFLARSKDLTGIQRADLQMLIGEAASLLGNYGSTRFGDALRRRQAELTAKLESMPKPVTALDVVELNRIVKQALAAGRAADAIVLIEEFLRRPGALEYRDRIDPSPKSIREKIEADRRRVTPR
jgi:hypothetical protein